MRAAPRCKTPDRQWGESLYVDTASQASSRLAKTMRFLTLVFLLAISVFGCSPRIEQGFSSENDQILRRAFESQARKLQVEGRGVVKQILPDDYKGSRHQRFILELSSGQTLLIAHNIDLAPRVPGPHVGDEVYFRGEYDWNPEGGVVHWTHDDPAGRHPGGWLKHQGQTYQ